MQPSPALLEKGHVSHKSTSIAAQVGVSQSFLQNSILNDYKTQGAVMSCLQVVVLRSIAGTRNML